MELTLRQRAKMLAAIEYHIDANLFKKVPDALRPDIVGFLMTILPDMREQVDATGSWDADKVYTWTTPRGAEMEATGADIDELFDIDRSGLLYCF